MKICNINNTKHNIIDEPIDDDYLREAYKQKLIDKKKPYLIIVNDDVLPHNKLKQYLKELHILLNITDWKLILLGFDTYKPMVSTHMMSLCHIFANEIPLSGSFAFAIHSSVYEHVLNPSIIQTKFPNLCYVSNPPLFMQKHISNIEYSMVTKYPIFILCKNNSKRLLQLLELVKMFDMKLEPVILHIGKPPKRFCVKKYNIVHSIQDIVNCIRHSVDTYYVLCNTFVNWTIDIPHNTVDYGIELLNKYDVDVVQPIMYDCPKCSNITYSNNTNICTEDIVKYYFVICRKKAVDNMFGQLKCAHFNLIQGYFYKIDLCRNLVKYDTQYHMKNIYDIQEDVIVWHSLYQDDIHKLWYSYIIKNNNIIQDIVKWWKIYTFTKIEDGLHCEYTKNTELMFFRVPNINILKHSHFDIFHRKNMTGKISLYLVFNKLSMHFKNKNFGHFTAELYREYLTRDNSIQIRLN